MKCQRKKSAEWQAISKTEAKHRRPSWRPLVLELKRSVLVPKYCEYRHQVLLQWDWSWKGQLGQAVWYEYKLRTKLRHNGAITKWKIYKSDQWMLLCKWNIWIIPSKCWGTSTAIKEPEEGELMWNAASRVWHGKCALEFTLAVNNILSWRQKIHETFPILVDS